MDGNAEHETAGRNKAMVTGLSINPRILSVFQGYEGLAYGTFRITDVTDGRVINCYRRKRLACREGRERQTGWYLMMHDINCKKL